MTQSPEVLRPEQADRVSATESGQRDRVRTFGLERDECAANKWIDERQF
jgi:hypothetical protein